MSVLKKFAAFQSPDDCEGRGKFSNGWDEVWYSCNFKLSEEEFLVLSQSVPLPELHVALFVLQFSQIK